MRKIINRRTYNTETSKEIGQWDNKLYYTDGGYYRETLYRNTKGAYFLHGEGGALSIYATLTTGGNLSWGEEIIAMAAFEAQEWAEKHLNTEEYEDEFGVRDETSLSDLTTRERVNLTLDSRLMARLRKHSFDTNIPMGRTVDKALTYSSITK